MVSSFIEKPCPQFLLGFVLINAYVPGIIGASIPTGWLFLLIAIPYFLIKDIRITEVHILGFLFLIYCTISLAWTPNLNIAWLHFLKAIILGCIFCLGSSLTNLRWIMIGLAVGLLPSDIIGIIQHFYNNPIVFALPGMTSGLFVNQNIFCEISASILLCLIIYKLWWYIPFTFVGIFLIHSRGAILGLISGLFILLFRVHRTSFYILATIFITMASVYFIDRSTTSIFERFDLWADTLKGLKIFGNGIGSFEILYPYYATLIDTSVARPRFAHNDLLQLIFELGIGVIFLLCMLYQNLNIRTNEKVILYGIGIMAMFSYSLNISAIGFIWFLVAGFASRGLPAVWDDGNNRGSYLSEGFTRS